jgi:hypothetical protein
MLKALGTLQHKSSPNVKASKASMGKPCLSMTTQPGRRSPADPAAHAQSGGAVRGGSRVQAYRSPDRLVRRRDSMLRPSTRPENAMAL